MSTTTTKTATARGLYNRGNLQLLEQGTKLTQLGTQLAKIKVTVAALTAAAAVDITAAATLAAATVAGIVLDAGENLPPIGTVVTLRVTAVGSGATGPRVVTDAGGTPAAPPTATDYAGAAVGLATLSDDGTTLTFEGTVTGFILEYFPAPTGGMDQAVTLSAP